MKQECTRCVGYLLGGTCQAMNKNARVKHKAKLCTCSSWFLVHLPSLWTKERCVEAGFMYAAPCFLFSSLQKVSGQQILEGCIRIWKGIFFLRFVVHIH